MLFSSTQRALAINSLDFAYFRITLRHYRQLSASCASVLSRNLDTTYPPCKLQSQSETYHSDVDKFAIFLTDPFVLISLDESLDLNHHFHRSARPTTCCHMFGRELRVDIVGKEVQQYGDPEIKEPKSSAQYDCSTSCTCSRHLPWDDSVISRRLT